MTLWLILCLFSVPSCAADVPVPVTEQSVSSSTAFIGVNVVPITEPEQLITDQTVLVQGEQIVTIGPRSRVDIPEEAVQIDGSGKYLMPGLADMHVHLEYFDDPAILTLFLASGVTTVRNMDGRPHILEWKRRISESDLLGPTIYSAGPLLDGDPPLRPDNTVVRNEAEAQAAVTDQYSAGYDFVKVYTNLSPEAYRAVLLKAREYDLPVVGHVPRDLDVTDAFGSGQAAIEHLGDYADRVEADSSPLGAGWHWSKRFLGMPMDLDRARSIAEQQAQVGVWTVPTMIQADRELAPLGLVRTWLEAPEMAYIGADGRDFWAELSQEAAEQMDDEDWELVTQGRRHRVELTRVLHEAGVQLLVGTDTPNPFVIPGFALHEELQNFVQAGLRPSATLAAATGDAARFLGDLQDWGTVESGKRADLLLLDASPLESIANVRQLAGVMVQGQWFPREELVRMLDSLRQPAR